MPLPLPLVLMPNGPALKLTVNEGMVVEVAKELIHVPPLVGWIFAVRFCTLEQIPLARNRRL